MGTAIESPVRDRVKPSFVIFDIRALCDAQLWQQWASTGEQAVMMKTVVVKGTWQRRGCRRLETGTQRADRHEQIVSRSHTTASSTATTHPDGHTGDSHTSVTAEYYDGE